MWQRPSQCQLSANSCEADVLHLQSTQAVHLRQTLLFSHGGCEKGPAPVLLLGKPSSRSLLLPCRCCSAGDDAAVPLTKCSSSSSGAAKVSAGRGERAADFAGGGSPHRLNGSSADGCRPASEAAVDALDRVCWWFVAAMPPKGSSSTCGAAEAIQYKTRRE